MAKMDSPVRGNDVEQGQTPCHNHGVIPAQARIHLSTAHSPHLVGRQRECRRVVGVVEDFDLVGDEPGAGGD